MLLKNIKNGSLITYNQNAKYVRIYKKIKKRQILLMNAIHTVSSFHIAWTWVPNITQVNIAKSNASNMSKMRNITVAGGDLLEHSARRRRIMRNILTKIN